MKTVIKTYSAEVGGDMEADIVAIDEAQEVIDSLKAIENEKNEKKRAKLEKKAPPEGKVMAAVAAVVLAEFEMWPEKIQSLIGEQHPQKQSFLKGVPYVIGAYAHLARKALEAERERRKREAELKTAGLLSPIAQERGEIGKEFQASVQQSVEDLERERKEKLAEAKKAINLEYERKISAAKGREHPERYMELVQQEAKIKGAFDKVCGIIDTETSVVAKQIEEIEGGAENWNSKKRKARRLAHAEAKAGSTEAEKVESEA